MNGVQLRDLITAIAWKRLTDHEVNPDVSNGHEFQGRIELRELLGKERREFRATYVLLRDDRGMREVVRSSASWYDARESSPRRAAEWRLYYPASAGVIQSRMTAGDLMVVARRTNDELLILLATAGSAAELQIETLFGLEAAAGFELHNREIQPQESVGPIAAAVLEELGLYAPQSPVLGTRAVSTIARLLIDEYPDRLPAGIVVTQMVQEHVSDVDAVADPDGTLVRWIETEDAVFRLWEDTLVGNRIQQGFTDTSGNPDVKSFREFTMRIRQSRVSRAGGALQNHVARILDLNNIRYDSQARVDDGEIPDFLFPGVAEYNDQAYSEDNLRMLAVKFTAKDRWRQVLNEAHRIARKHLLTLEAGISRRQLEMMHAASLQPVLPARYGDRYPLGDRELLISLSDFIRGLPTEARIA